MATQAQMQLGDFRIEVSKLPTMRAVKLSALLGRVIGPAIAAAFQGVVKAAKASGGLDSLSIGDVDVSEINLDAIAGALFARLGPDELEQVLRELLSATTCNGQPVMEGFDVLFADKLELLPPLVKFVLGFQFGSFGRALFAVGGAAMTKAVRESASS